MKQSPRVWFAMMLSTTALLSVGALGCGASQHDDVASSHHRGARKLPALHEDDDDEGDAKGTDVVHWEAKLTEEAPGLLQEFERRASRYGCQTRADDDSVVARCAEAPIKLVKRGRNVSVACQGVSLTECRDLFGRIVDVEKESRGGQNPRMW